MGIELGDPDLQAENVNLRKDVKNQFFSANLCLRSKFYSNKKIQKEFDMHISSVLFIGPENGGGGFSGIFELFHILPFQKAKFTLKMAIMHKKLFTIHI